MIFGLVMSCGSVLTDDDEEVSPFPNIRSWGTPEAIEVAGLGISRSYSISLSLSVDLDDNPQLLIRVPLDAAPPHKKYKMAHLSYSGGSWALKKAIEAPGDFDPIRTIVGDNEETHYIWSGVKPEEEEIWINDLWHLPELFYCTSIEFPCTSPVLLASIPWGTGWARFRTIVRDGMGHIHIVADMDGQTYHYTLENGNLISENLLGYRNDPYVINVEGKLHMVYNGDPPESGQNGNAVYHQVFNGVDWLEPNLLFHDPEEAPAYPTLAIDENGQFHVVFYSNNPAGDVPLHYVSSNNKGESWSDPQVINRNLYGQIRPPSIKFDNENKMHLVFSHSGEVSPDSAHATINNYYLTQIEGQWSEVIELFPKHHAQSDALLTITESGEVHFIQTGFDKKVYHIQLK